MQVIQISTYRYPKHETRSGTQISHAWEQQEREEVEGIRGRERSYKRKRSTLLLLCAKSTAIGERILCNLPIVETN